MVRTIGILTGGGDVPGLNPCIKAVVMAALEEGYRVMGIARGWAGLLNYNLDEPFTYEPLAWAVNKGDPDFLNWLNNFLRQTKGDGFYDRLYQKWIIGSDWKKELE